MAAEGVTKVVRTVALGGPVRSTNHQNLMDLGVAGSINQSLRLLYAIAMHLVARKPIIQCSLTRKTTLRDVPNMPLLISDSLRDSLMDLTIATQRRLNFRPEERRAKEIDRWRETGKLVPPHHSVKERIVARYASAFGVAILVETGTFLGEMDYALRDVFREIYSIELGAQIAQRARRLLRSYPHIQVMQGDSATVLPQILAGISEPCMFWLDGHYSAGITAKGNLATPVMQELKTIFAHTVKDHVVLIDDARCFDGTHDYPTLDGVSEFVAAHRPNFAFSVANDVIRIHPQLDVQCDL